MKFKMVKNGYEPVEVEEYIKRLREVYDKTLVSQRDRIFEQRDEYEKLEKRLSEYEKNESIVGKSIESAVSKAEEIKEGAKSKYAEEIARLREFHEVWVQYFSRIKEKYPLDDELGSLGEMNDKIGSVLGEAESFVPRQSEGFNPISMIETLLASTYADENAAEMPSGVRFNYDEAQNPKDDIRNILGDLGIKQDDLV